MNTQSTAEPRKEVTFDENGQTIEAAESLETLESGDESLEAAPAPVESLAGKYKIGDRTFATQDEAFAYAQQLESELQVADAYRQGLRDAAPQTAQPDSVTPAPQDDLDTDELYTNPKEFIQKLRNRTKEELLAEVQARENTRNQSDQIWRDFTDRHPALADFRGEVEDFVSKNLTSVRAIIGTRGQSAGYDWVATKLKSRFESYANAVKPSRELPNGRAATAPTAKGPGVTLKPDAKKALSFSEQIRMLKSKRR
jgi:hypothetical protein